LVGPTVAVVDAFIDPHLESDLAYYRSYWGLPPCTQSNGCYREIDLGTATSQGWGQEESADVEMVSALCPGCRILLVAASDQSNANLIAAEQVATANAQYVSNSWDLGKEDPSFEKYDSVFEVPGVLYTVASGDNGYKPAQYPAVLPSVVAVGGTYLYSISPRGETAWAGSGSACSTIYPKPVFQSGIFTGCSMRALADVSADAGYPVAVYDTFLDKYYQGWNGYDGTSIATPMIAAMFAYAGSTGGDTQLYANENYLYDITTGSNGTCGVPLCQAGVGWDGPSGLGAPDGIEAFSVGGSGFRDLAGKFR
jgi:subtilase family serine protease